MHSLNPTRIVARRGRDAMIIGALLMMSGLVAGGATVLVLLLLPRGFFDFILLFIVALLLLVGVGFLIRGLTFRMENAPALLVNDVLMRELDDRYTFIRNISRQGLGYIDGVLVGPPGALVFAIVDQPGIFMNEGADWLERKGGNPFMLSRLNATRACVNDVYALRKWLAKRHMTSVPVYGIVVFTDPSVQITARQPTVPVAELRTLFQVMRGDFMKADRIDAKLVEATVSAIYQ